MLFGFLMLVWCFVRFLVEFSEVVCLMRWRCVIIVCVVVLLFVSCSDSILLNLFVICWVVRVWLGWLVRFG